MLVRMEGFAWHRAATRHDDIVFAKGFLYLGDGKVVEKADLAEYLASRQSSGNLGSVLSQANGSFACVVVTPSLIWAAVDAVRSMPLFFATEDGRLLLSDDADTIRQALTHVDVDNVSVSEFVLCGYAVGQHTLYKQIMEIRAGEWMQFRDGAPKTHRYYLHLHGNYLHASKAEKYDALAALSKRVGDRLVASVSARPIILPLSGGYDSRYIACLLHEANFANVICYTYGRPDSKEVAVSRTVAKALGFPWHYIEYKDELLLDTLRNDQRWHEYCWYCHNLGSLPHVQEYVALRELHAAGALPSDGVAVPGFCGDLLGGSYVPVEVKAGNSKALLERGIVDYIADRHAVNRLFYSETLSSDSGERIRNDLADYPVSVSDIGAFIGTNEAWFTSHKVAKFVVNSLRVYEFFGHEWRMPLWDRELIDYWYRIPLVDRLHKELYDGFLFDYYFNPLDIGIRKEATNRLLRLHQRLTSIGVPSEAGLKLLKRAKRLYTRLKPAAPHFNAFDVMEDFYLKDMPALAETPLQLPNINGIYARWFIQKYYGQMHVPHTET